MTDEDQRNRITWGGWEMLVPIFSAQQGCLNCRHFCCKCGIVGWCANPRESQISRIGRCDIPAWRVPAEFSLARLN